MIKVDLEGRIFGRLTVIGYAGSNGHKSLWKCLCSCGNETVKIGTYLLHGHTNSCGCLKYKHHHSTESHKSKTYQVWCAMKERCRNPKHVGAKYYLNRGIKVCERWMDFNNFLSDMGEVPENRSIDRIDVYGNYEPKNCRWATLKEQGQNRRRNCLVPGEICID